MPSVYIIAVIAVAVVAVLRLVAVERRRARLEAAPIIRTYGTLVSKRVSADNVRTFASHISGNVHYATFRLADGDELELKVGRLQDWGALHEGDRGEIAYQQNALRRFTVN